jgi:hypothetical protein
MRHKLTALLASVFALAFAASAHAQTVPVAVYSFQTAGDVAAFQKQSGAKCEKKWVKNKQMSVSVGAKTVACALRSSVVADSSDPAADMEVSALGSLGSGIEGKLLKKAYVGVAARSSETSGYELRVFPGAQKWQLWRDPRGAPPPALFRAGKGAFIKQTKKKPLSFALRAFDGGSTTQTTVTAFIAGKAVLTHVDTAADQPDGRRSVITTGVKGTAPGTGVVGIFDNVAIKVPSPF